MIIHVTGISTVSGQSHTLAFYQVINADGSIARESSVIVNFGGISTFSEMGEKVRDAILDIELSATEDQIFWAGCSVIETFKEGVRQMAIKSVIKTAQVDAQGNAVFDVTDPNGDAYFKEEIYFPIHFFENEDTDVIYRYRNVTISEDRKTVTVKVKKLLNTLSILSQLQMGSAAAGIVVHARFLGR
jgi:hypothetical protein